MPAFLSPQPDVKTNRRTRKEGLHLYGLFRKQVLGLRLAEKPYLRHCFLPKHAIAVANPIITKVEGSGITLAIQRLPGSEPSRSEPKYKVFPSLEISGAYDGTPSMLISSILLGGPKGEPILGRVAIQISAYTLFLLVVKKMVLPSDEIDGMLSDEGLRD